MSQALSEIALLEDVSNLPSDMQKIYLQLVSAIDHTLQKHTYIDARSDHIDEEFIENLVTQMLSQELTQQQLEECVAKELQRKILISADLSAVC